MKRYLLVIPVAAVLFIVLAMLHQSETFLPLLGIGKDPNELDPAQAKLAVAVVRRFNVSLQKAHRTRSPAALRRVSEPLKKRLTRAVFYARAQGDPAPRMVSFKVLRVEPAGPSSWTVLTDETWRWPVAPGRPAKRTRLRWRYALATDHKKLQITSMQPRLPDPTRGRQKGR